MVDPLQHSRYSLDHAQRRLDELEREIDDFHSFEPYARVVDSDTEPGQDIHKLKLVRPISKPIPGITFDALSSMRAALDQAGRAVAVAAGKSGRHAKWPFGDTEAEANSRNLSKAPSREIPREVFDVMMAFKPYKGGNHLLWALNKASNSHKHEIVVPVGVAVGVTQLNNFKFIGSGSMKIPAPVWDRTKNEMELVRVPHGNPVQYDFQLDAFEAFNNIEGIDNKPILGILYRMLSEVKSCLMCIEGEARRLGLFS